MKVEGVNSETGRVEGEGRGGEEDMAKTLSTCRELLQELSETPPLLPPSLLPSNLS